DSDDRKDLFRNLVRTTIFGFVTVDRDSVMMFAKLLFDALLNLVGQVARGRRTHLSARRGTGDRRNSRSLTKRAHGQSERTCTGNKRYFHNSNFEGEMHLPCDLDSKKASNWLPLSSDFSAGPASRSSSDWAVRLRQGYGESPQPSRLSAV